MNHFVFVDSSNEKYTISFNWAPDIISKDKCTIFIYPNKWNNDSLAMCSYRFSDHIHLEDNKEWTKEFLSQDTIEYINKIIKNKAFW